MAKKKGQEAPQVQQRTDVKQKQKTQQQPQHRQPQQQRTERPAGGLQHYSSYLQVLAVDIDHTSPSVLLFFNKERYLFNAGEGIQRLFREHKIKTKQVTSYFITRISTETLGGLPGMALSVAPEGASGMLGKQAACTVKGPRGLADYVASFRPYVNAEASVDVEEIDPKSTEPLVKTDVVSITPILLRVPAGAASSRAPSSGGGPADPEAGAGAEADGASGSPAAKRRRTDVGGAEAAEPAGAAGGSPGSQAEDDEAADGSGRRRPAGASRPQQLAVYCVQLAGRPGKFMPDKARALGVTPGPLFGELQRGRPVTSESGRVVQPHEVAEAALPGPSVLLLDTPSREALQAVAADERVRAFAAEAASGDGTRACVAVHLVPAALAADESALASFRSQLGPSWRHLLVSSGPHQPSSLPRASVFQARLHALHPTAFPLIALDNASAPPALPEAAKPAAPAAPPPASPAAGGAAAPSAVPLQLQQQWPSLPVPPGGCASGMSAVRLNLMPPARQGLEYIDVFQYDSSSKVLEDLRSDPEYAEVLAAAAAVRDGGAAASTAAAETRTATAAAEGAAEAAGSKDGVEEKAEASAPQDAPMEQAATSGEGAGAAEGGQEAGTSGPQADAEMTDRPAEGTAPAAADEAEGVAAAAAEPERPRESASAVDELPECLAGGDRRLVELTFLGTASSQPSKYRNVSGCYVDLFARGGLLVDCGEDAMGQMKRRFGTQDAERRLLELRLVWVSHMHADHHGGLYRLLEWRAERGAPPLLVIGPRRLFEVLLKYSAAVHTRGFTFLSNFSLSDPEGERRPPPHTCVAAYESAVAALGLRSLAPFTVEHIYDSHGLRLEGQAGWSLVFSGDTRPCQQTVSAARGATLLVHEATFEESMQAEARAKKHSTTAEAVSVGERAGAYRTLLTHFSTRYPTLPELDLSPHPRVAVAMDLMSVNLADLPWLPRLVRPMGLLFKRLEEDKLADAEDDD